MIKKSFEGAQFIFEVKSLSARGIHISRSSNAGERGIVTMYGDKANVHLASIKSGYTDKELIYLESEMLIHNYVVTYLD